LTPRRDVPGRGALLWAALGTGLFAGLMVTFVGIIDRVLASLPAAEYTRVMQGLIKAADVPPVAPLPIMVGLIAGGIAAWQLRKAGGGAYRLALAGFLVLLLGAFVTTMAVNAPINFAILKWDPAAPPADWEAVRDRWHTFSVLRTVSSVVAFACFLLALVRSGHREADIMGEGENGA
jgi:Predicted integral membrane protein